MLVQDFVRDAQQSADTLVVAKALSLATKNEMTSDVRKLEKWKGTLASIKGGPPPALQAAPPPCS